MKIHKTQEKLLALLKRYLDNPLTIRELQEKLELSSPSMVQHHVQMLERKGFLKRNPSNPKDYQILNEPEKQITYINLYGLAQCGPDGTILTGDPIDRIPIASRLLKFPAKDAFIVKAKGDSMEPKIYAGDLVIAEKIRKAEHGDIVVCVHDEKALIKQFQKGKDGIILHSLNIKHAPIIASDELRIEGVVRNVLRYE